MWKLEVALGQQMSAQAWYSCIGVENRTYSCWMFREHEEEIVCIPFMDV
jgi:hypothetical protein